MASDEDKRWRCSNCNEISLETELLLGASPFRDMDTLQGCPKCFHVEGTTTLVEVCDEPGCNKEATCGFPVDDEAFGNYRRTCWKHYRGISQRRAKSQ